MKLVRTTRACAVAALALFVMACTSDPSEPADPSVPAREPVTLRVATFNTSLFQDAKGLLVRRLDGGQFEPAKRVAAVLQAVRPDVVLLNEFDYDDAGRGAQLFAEQYLAVSQGAHPGLELSNRFLAPVNTGISSGFDLNNDGRVDTTPGDRSYGGDSYGYGLFEGQYGMVVLSRYPVVASRTFQELKWTDMPDPGWPDDPQVDGADDWYNAEERAALRLSSKSHWDLSIDVGGEVLHLLASHPTPPSFDGPEDRNGLRNDAELRFWLEYLDGADWMTDDAGNVGPLGSGSFVIVGDLNADPIDGERGGGAMARLVSHERVHDQALPTSLGAEAASAEQGGINAEHEGPPSADTTDWSDVSPGNLRVDYALPSANLTVLDAGVFWPVESDPDAALIDVSDHRAVWVDVRL